MSTPEPIAAKGRDPNFLVIGSGKCATSSLCHRLAGHPEVFMCDPREPNFFSNDDIYERGLDWYRGLFAGGHAAKAVGEGSGRYTAKEIYPAAAERVARHLPHARLIYITRHPLRRIESVWMQQRGQGNHVSASFSKAVRERPETVHASNYLSQIEEYRKFFPDDRILVLFMEDFAADQEAVLKRCFEFLDVSPAPTTSRPEAHSNRSDGKRVDRASVSWLRRRAWFRGLRNLVPAGFRRGIRERYLQTRIEGRPEWDPETLARVRELLRDDTREFLLRYGKSPDFWNLDEEPVRVV